ncbi:hypothetical protein ACIQ6K_33785 [Streptomyces sp. NPDC096354]|uniref:hypothetical protein n=1 Tax=Streptomyces sp. NPDC096354 TaxID=3366088 RepID=UPI0038261A0F
MSSPVLVASTDALHHLVTHFFEQGRVFEADVPRLSATTPTTLCGAVLRDTRLVEWFEQVQAAEQRQDWNVAIALVCAHAECYSTDPSRHDSHLWHMDLLARAERFSELTERALTDVHARRRLNRALHERGMAAALRNRAEAGDRDALYVLVRLLCETSRPQEADRAVQDLGPDDQYAHQIVARFRSSPGGAQYRF